MTPSQLRLAIATAIVDRIPLETIQDRLWREDRDHVAHLYTEIALMRMGMDPVSSSAVQRERAKQPKPQTRDAMGVPVAALAELWGMDQATLRALLEYHGFLSMAWHNRQRRLLVSNAVFQAGYGHNVTPSNRIGHLEGHNVACVFPVFYPDRLEEIREVLGYEGIRAMVDGLPSKKAKLAYLMADHSYLPDKEIAQLAGYSLSGVEKARAREQQRAA